MEATFSHVLLVDDDLETSHRLGEYLSENDFRVTVVETGKPTLDVIAREVVDVLLLEPRLRIGNEAGLTKTVRESMDLPTVIVSRRGEEADRVMELELGADDYVTKPFSSREVLARIRAVLRRYHSTRDAVRDATLRAYRFAGWELNLRLYRLTSPERRRVELSRGEFRLLRAFLASPQRVLTRDQLLDLTRIDGTEVYDRSIDVQVARLRRSLEADPANPRFIKTERGQGYYFDNPVSVIRQQSIHADRDRETAEDENPMESCEHLQRAAQPFAKPRTVGCEECLAAGEQWVQLRVCLICGHVGCCDSSAGKHATGHFQQTQHEVMRSSEPGDTWGWCYVHQRTLGPFPSAR